MREFRPLAMSPNPDPWPAGPAMVRDLVAAVASHSTTACDIEQARRGDGNWFCHSHFPHA